MIYKSLGGELLNGKRGDLPLRPCYSHGPPRIGLYGIYLFTIEVCDKRRREALITGNGLLADMTKMISRKSLYE